MYFRVYKPGFISTTFLGGTVSGILAREGTYQNILLRNGRKGATAYVKDLATATLGFAGHEAPQAERGFWASKSIDQIIAEIVRRHSTGLIEIEGEKVRDTVEGKKALKTATDRLQRFPIWTIEKELQRRLDRSFGTPKFMIITGRIELIMVR